MGDSNTIPAHIIPQKKYKISISINNHTGKNINKGILRIQSKSSHFLFSPLIEQVILADDIVSFKINDDLFIAKNESITKELTLYCNSTDWKKETIVILFNYENTHSAEVITAVLEKKEESGFEKNLQTIITLCTTIIGFIYFLIDKFKKPNSGH